jgi:hypothetical protein
MKDNYKCLSSLQGTLVGERNSQILRRPQDDSKKGGRHPMFAQVPKIDCQLEAFTPSLSSYVCRRRPKLIVILRPPKDLAVLPLEERCANIR